MIITDKNQNTNTTK